MKAQLRPSSHLAVGDTAMIELWYGDEFIAGIYGGDGPSVRIVTKHKVHVEVSDDPPHVAEVSIVR